MESPRIDPEELFWQQIQNRPFDPLPRLVYADWCDENDRPVMAVVQRWLAATGRMPTEWHQRSWRWYSDQSPPILGIEKFRTLPHPLFRQLSIASMGYVHRERGKSITFATRRQCEEALVDAWTKATARSRFRRAWKPDFGKAEGVLRRPTKPTPAPAAPQSERSGTEWFLLLAFFGLVRACIGPSSSAPPRFEPPRIESPSLPRNDPDLEAFFKQMREVQHKQDADILRLKEFRPSFNPNFPGSDPWPSTEDLMRRIRDERAPLARPDGVGPMVGPPLVTSPKLPEKSTLLKAIREGRQIRARRSE